MKWSWYWVVDFVILSLFLSTIIVNIFGEAFKNFNSFVLQKIHIHENGDLRIPVFSWLNMIFSSSLFTACVEIQFTFGAKKHYSTPAWAPHNSFTASASISASKSKSTYWSWSWSSSASKSISTSWSASEAAPR